MCGFTSRPIRPIRPARASARAQAASSIAPGLLCIQHGPFQRIEHRNYTKLHHRTFLFAVPLRDSSSAFDITCASGLPAAHAQLS